MATPLKRPISPERPLLIIMIKPAQSYEQEAADLVRLWDGFDGFLQHHVTVQIEGTAGNDFERCETVLRYAAPAGIPITLQIQGDNGDRQDTMPPGRVRDFLDRYDNIIGLQIVEASQRTFVNQPAGPEYTMGRNARYARDIIELAGERGLFMSWQLMRDNWAAIGCSVDNEALFDTISSHAANVIPTHEMNCEFCKPIDHLGAMGLWMSGATAQWAWRLSRGTGRIVDTVGRAAVSPAPWTCRAGCMRSCSFWGLLPGRACIRSSRRRMHGKVRTHGVSPNIWSRFSADWSPNA